MGSVRATWALARVRMPVTGRTGAKDLGQVLDRTLGESRLGGGQVLGQAMSGGRPRPPGAGLEAGVMKVDWEHASSAPRQNPGATGWHGGQCGCILSLHGGSRRGRLVGLTLPVRAVRVQTLTVRPAAPCRVQG